MELQQPGIEHKFVASIPIAGPALSMWLEHTEMGIARYGKFLGLLRGALIGLILCISLIVVSETAVLLFDVGRTETANRWGEPWKARRNEAAAARSLKDKRDHMMMPSDPFVLNTALRYYLISDPDEARFIKNGLTPYGAEEFLERFYTERYRSSRLIIAPAGTVIRPFVFRGNQHEYASDDIADKGLCIFASLNNGSVILIPKHAWSNARKGEIN